MFLQWVQDLLLLKFNPFWFNSTQKKQKNLLRGVVHGIGGYGNCMGVPTIAGQTSLIDHIMEIS